MFVEDRGIYNVIRNGASCLSTVLITFPESLKRSEKKVYFSLKACPHQTNVILSVIENV